MAETNFRFTGLKVWREDIQNQIPANPKALVVKGMINCSVKETQRTEVNTTLDSGGQGSKKDRGSSDFAGNLECKITGDMMPFIATHVIGAPASVESAETGVWGGTTVYARFEKHTLVGDIVSLPGTPAFFLVCKKSGTSGALEPVPTEVGEIIETDGDVVWEARLPIWKYVGSSEACLPSFGMENTAGSGCSGTPETFQKRFQGCYLDSYEFSKASGGTIHKYSMPVKGSSAVDNVIGNPDGTAFASIEDEAGYAETLTVDKAYSYDDLMIQFSGMEPVDARDFTMSINRSFTLDDALAINSKVSDNPNMVVEGSINVKFTKEQYEEAYNSISEPVKILYGNDSGSAAHFTLPSVEKDRSDPDFTVEKSAYAMYALTADGDNTTKTMSYIIYSEVNYQA